jgi:hypothetical protein
MSSFSDYTENKVLDHVLGKTSFTMPSTVAVALFTAAPSDSGGGTEVSNSNNYSRKTTAGADWSAASGGATSNANAITFATPSGSWGTVTHFAIFDSATHGAGNMLMWAPLSASQAIGAGNTVSFAAGDLDVSLT